MIDPAQADRLKDIGAWSQNGGIRHARWSVETHEGDHQHAQGQHGLSPRHEIGNWRIELPALPAEIKSARCSRGARSSSSRRRQAFHRHFAVGAGTGGHDCETGSGSSPMGTSGDHAGIRHQKPPRRMFFRKTKTEYGAQQAFDNDPPHPLATDGGTKQRGSPTDLGRPHDDSKCPHPGSRELR